MSGALAQRIDDEETQTEGQAASSRHDLRHGERVAQPE